MVFSNATPIGKAAIEIYHCSGGGVPPAPVRAQIPLPNGSERSKQLGNVSFMRQRLCHLRLGVQLSLNILIGSVCVTKLRAPQGEGRH